MDNIIQLLNIFLPNYVGLLVFYYYNKMSQYTETYFTQFNRTIDAVRGSFTSVGILCFYDEIPIPIYLESLKEDNRAHSEIIRWYYISDKNLFVDNLTTTTTTTKRIPWISAEIHYNGILKAYEALNKIAKEPEEIKR